MTGYTVSSLSCCPSLKLSPSLTPDLPNPSISSFITTRTQISTTQLRRTARTISSMSSLSETFTISPLESGKTANQETPHERGTDSVIDVKEISPSLVEKLVYDALVWSSLHGLVVGDKRAERSGTIPGVALVHAPFSLLPTPFPPLYWRQACELAPIFNELVDRVSLDGAFLQESLSRTKKVDAFTSRLLDIHMQMLENNRKEEICLGLHRSDYMLDAETKELLQVELNTISSSFAGLSCLVSELHSKEKFFKQGNIRNLLRKYLETVTRTIKCVLDGVHVLIVIYGRVRYLLNHYGKELGLDSGRVLGNSAFNRYADALALAWSEYNDSSAVIMVVVQTEERNMYDQHWLCTVLKEKHNIVTVRKTLAQVDAEGGLLPDGTLHVGQQKVAVVYFRAGYSPNDYPSESEWRGRLLIEQSCAIKCPSISYHLVGTKKIQQELAKPNVLERFLDNKDDILKLRKCFAGLWSLDDSNVIQDAVARPELFVLKPQREGGGNNIYGEMVREKLAELQKEGGEAVAAFILMQRIFPTSFTSFLVRDGICHQGQTISELGIFSAYLRNKDKVILNDHCGYLMRTKVSSSDEGGVAAGFAVLDSIYLT